MTGRRWVFAAFAALLAGALFIVGLPLWQRHTHLARTTEAYSSVRWLVETSEHYYAHGGCLPGIHLNCRQMPVEIGDHHRFPEAVELTPAGLPFCEDGEPIGHPIDPTDWQHPTWRALRFRPEEPLYFRYSYLSSGVDGEARFTARVVGDLDCDGVLWTFERIGDIEQERKGDGFQRSRELNPEFAAAAWRQR